MSYQEEYEVVYKWTNGLLEFVSIVQVPVPSHKDSFGSPSVQPTRNSFGSPSAKPFVQPTRKYSKAMSDSIALYSPSTSRQKS